MEFFFDLKQRASPMSKFEKDLLISLVLLHNVENKKTDAVSAQEKKKGGWIRLYDDFNATLGVSKREVAQLQKCWSNLKEKCRKERALQNRHAAGTGGGGPIAPPSEISQKVDACMPHLNFRYESPLDSDACVARRASEQSGSQGSTALNSGATTSFSASPVGPTRVLQPLQLGTASSSHPCSLGARESPGPMVQKGKQRKGIPMSQTPSEEPCASQQGAAVAGTSSSQYSDPILEMQFENMSHTHTAFMGFMDVEDEEEVVSDDLAEREKENYSGRQAPSRHCEIVTSTPARKRPRVNAGLQEIRRNFEERTAQGDAIHDIRCRHDTEFHALRMEYERIRLEALNRSIRDEARREEERHAYEMETLRLIRERKLRHIEG